MSCITITASSAVGRIVTPEAKIIGLMIKYNVVAEKVRLKPEHFRDPDLRHLFGFLGGDGPRSVDIEKLRRAAFAGHEFARYGVWLVDAAAADDVDDPVAAIAILAEQIRKPNGDPEAPASNAKKSNGASPRDINDIRTKHGTDAVRDAFDKAVNETAARGPAQKISWRDHVIKPRDLCDRIFPEVHFVVPGIFPEGVTLLASRPKLGKSWLVLQITTAIASGTITLVATDQPVCGDVLYLALEDNQRRLQRRLTKYFGAQRENWPDRLKLVTTWRRLDQGGLDDLREWCREVAKPTLIVIDVLKKVRPPKAKNQSDYEADYTASEGLKRLADEYPGLAIICVHHDRKMDADDVFDTVSGTLGLTGGVDTVAIMKRSGKGVTLHVEGRDLVEPVEKAISFDRDTCRWTILGEAAEVHRSGERSRVLVALANLPDGLTVSEIQGAAQLGKRSAVDVLLSRMVGYGEIVRTERGRYALPQYRSENVRNSKEYEESPAKSHTPAETPASNTSNTDSERDHTPALEFLRWALTPGRRSVRDIEASAREEGLLGERQRIDNAKSLQDAKCVLRVVVERDGFGAGSKVYWRLPDNPSQDAAPQAKDDAAVQTPEREPGGNQ